MLEICSLLWIVGAYKICEFTHVQFVVLTKAYALPI